MAWPDPPRIDTTPDRWHLSRLTEPTLALLSLAVILSFQQDYDIATLAWASAVTIHLGAAASGRWPFAAAVLALAGVAMELPLDPDVTTTSSMALLINAASAVARNIRHAAPIAAVTIAGSFVGLVLHFDHFSPTFPSVLSFVSMTLVALGAAVLWRVAARRLSRQREESRHHIEELRLELARELHDTVAQSLSHAAMRAWMAAEGPGVPDSTRQELARIAEDCASSAADLRQMLSTLRAGGSSITPDLGPLADADTLAATVEEQAQRLRDHGLAVTTDVRLGVVSTARSATLAKVVREVANNILKHAPPGSECSLTLHEEDAVLHGVFVNRAPDKRVGRVGLGLVGIEERLRLLNGTAEVSMADGLWRTHVTLPTGQRHLVPRL